MSTYSEEDPVELPPFFLLKKVLNFVVEFNLNTQPLTADNPKCLVKIDGQSLIEWQIDELARCGVDRVSIVAGYHADRVQQLLHRRYDSQRIRTVYNPTYSWTDNLFSCWAARAEMTEDFVLINGDTLFEAAVLNRLLETPDRPVTVVTHKKRRYDALLE